MRKVFIGCSSFDSIDDVYKDYAYNIADICAKKEYGLVFGTRLSGMMGALYERYIDSDLTITAVCDKDFIEDINYLDKKRVEVVVTSSIESQIKEFMKCDKIIYLPGGYGTLTELTYLINEKANNIHNKDIIIVNINNFYDKLLEHFDKCFKEKFTNDNSLYKVINSYEELDNYL